MSENSRIDPNKKCITTFGWRNKDGETYVDSPPEGLVTIPKALETLLKYELGFGGEVVRVSETEIKTETMVLGHCKDTTVFKGEKEDMLPLLQAVWAQATKSFSEKAWNQAIEQLGENGNLPFFLCNFGPILQGQNIVKIAMLLACGVTEEADINRCSKLRSDDIKPALELMLESGKSLPETLNELGL